MNCDLEIIVKPRDHKGLHLVIAKHSGSELRDKFDVDSNFHRKNFRAAVITRFALDEEAHGFIETEIIKQAVAVDGAAAAEFFKPVVTMLDTVTPTNVEWLWQNRFPIGKLSLICGDPGLSKSLLLLDIAARITRGDGFPDSHDVAQEPGGVVILTNEDEAEDTIVPRLLAHGADLSRVAHVEGKTEIDGDGNIVHGIDLLHDIEHVRAVINQVDNCRLLIIDPIDNYIGKTDSHKGPEVRAVLSPLTRLIRETRVGLSAVSHFRKSDGRAVHKPSGSVAFVAVARTAWAITRCPTNPRRRLMTCIKNNLAEDTSGLAYTVEPYGPDDSPVICWEREPIHMSADEAMATPKSRGPAPDDREAAAAWLRDQLTGGPKPAADILEEAESQGFNARTVQRAFNQIDGQRQKRGFSGGWLWSLPEDDTEGDTQSRHKQLVAFGETCRLRENPEEDKIQKKTNKLSSREDDKLCVPMQPDAFDEFEAERREANGHGDVWF